MVQVVQERSITGETSAAEPIWQRIFRKSLFEFANPDLEGGYQTYLAKHASDYVMAYAPMFIMSWLHMLYCTVVNGRSTWSDPPPGLMYSVLLYLLPGGGLIAFAWLRKSVYAMHWRGINVAVMSVHVFHNNPYHLLCLWLQSCVTSGTCRITGRSSKGSEAGPSWATAFGLENFFLSVVCLRLWVMSAGAAADIFFTTVGMLLAMAGNEALCASSLWGPVRVTLSAPLGSIPKKVSALVLATVFPEGGWLLPEEELSCPSVLAFWQVVGWLAGCLFILMREILSRRAYLKSANLPLSPSVISRAKNWPFGSMGKTILLLQALLCMFLTSTIIWATVLALRL